MIIYNHYVSTLAQLPTAKQLFPLVVPNKNIPTPDNNLDEDKSTTSTAEILFEPSPSIVLEHLLPRILESQIFQAILESDASEHSARMVMMKNATESAGDIIDDLTLTFNKLRQNRITTELSEITAGKIALENK